METPTQRIPLLRSDSTKSDSDENLTKEDNGGSEDNNQENIDLAGSGPSDTNDHGEYSLCENNTGSRRCNETRETKSDSDENLTKKDTGRSEDYNTASSKGSLHQENIDLAGSEPSDTNDHGEHSISEKDMGTRRCSETIDRKSDSDENFTKEDTGGSEDYNPTSSKGSLHQENIDLAGSEPSDTNDRGGGDVLDKDLCNHSRQESHRSERASFQKKTDVESGDRSMEYQNELDEMSMQQINAIQAQQMESLRQANDGYQQEIRRLTGEIQELIGKNTGFQDEINKLTYQVNQLKTSSETYKQKKQKLEKEHDTNIKQLEKENQTLQSQQRNHEIEMKRISLSWKNCWNEEKRKWAETCAHKDRQIQETKEERDALLLRYSKLAGEYLTKGNTNVTDLSDPKRPTKLAEQFSELYDNEWTNAFEELEEVSDDEKVKILLGILKRAYELCMEISSTESLDWSHCTTYVDHRVEYGRTDTCITGTAEEEIPQRSTNDRLHLHTTDKTDSMKKEEDMMTNQKSTAENSFQMDSMKKEEDMMTNQKSTAENSFQTDSMKKEEDMMTNQKSTAENSFQTDSMKKEEDMMTNKKSTAENSFQTDNMNKEEDMMTNQKSTAENSFQNLETAESSTEKMSFNDEEQRIRIKKINLLHAHIPELESDRERAAIQMLLHIKKRILSEASVKVLPDIRKWLMEELKVSEVPGDGAGTNMAEYIKKCCELCFFMCVKEPTLYIDFSEENTCKGVLFDNSKYKAYTRKGKYIQFLVWPCLYLEKDGALLNKGIAQGNAAPS